MRKVINAAFVLVMVITLIIPMAVEAADTNVVAVNDESESGTAIIPKVNWIGTVYLEKGQWINVTGSNNIFRDRPTVTSNALNAGTIDVRIINGSGEQVGYLKRLKPGNSVKLDTIPAFSGDYILQARALEESGIYTISID